MVKRLLFIVNDPAFFVSHRLPIAITAQQAGYEVHVAAGVGLGLDSISKAGCIYHSLPLSRSGKNPIREIKCFWLIYRLIVRIKPDVVHNITIKPVIYGGIAARLARVPALVAAVSGLGAVFIAYGFKAWLRKCAVKLLYRLSFSHKNIAVIFQNQDDKKMFIEQKLLTHNKTRMIRGSGVAIKDYPFLPEPEGVPIVLMASRLLKDKGVIEFVEAASILKAQGVDCRFWLAGSVDNGNPATITEKELSEWKNQNIVKMLGYKDDIANLFSLAHIVVLPSYREGLPKVLVEAAACGRAIVTTNVPGCRDAIESNVSGLLVPARDAETLAQAIRKLIEDVALRKIMGKAGRELAEREFGIEKIVEAHLDIYRELTGVCKSICEVA